MSIHLSFFLLAQQVPVGQGLLFHEVSRSHTTTHHNRQDSSGRVSSSSQRHLPDNTNTNKRQTSKSPLEFEPKVSAGAQSLGPARHVLHQLNIIVRAKSSQVTQRVSQVEEHAPNVNKSLKEGDHMLLACERNRRRFRAPRAQSRNPCSNYAGCI